MKIITPPNLISLSRIVLSPAMYFLWGNKWMLFALLIVIGLTDILDGFLARKLKKQTLFGAWLDSIADFVFFIAFIVFAVLFEYESIIKLKYLIPVIILVKLLSAATGLIKYKRPGFLHTIGNKIAGTVIIAGICVFVLFRHTLIVEIGLYISIVSALEEFFIILLGKRYVPDIKGIWVL